MTDHAHSQYVAGCFRCDLSRDEVGGIMTDLNPDLIDHAAKALWDEPGWDRASHEQRQHHREAAERALSAALPDIIQQAKAEALREAADAIDLEDAAKQSGLSDLDFYWTGHYWESAAEEWLRARAGKAERGES